MEEACLTVRKESYFGPIYVIKYEKTTSLTNESELHTKRSGRIDAETREKKPQEHKEA